MIEDLNKKKRKSSYSLKKTVLKKLIKRKRTEKTQFSEICINRRKCTTNCRVRQK